MSTDFQPDWTMPLSEYARIQKEQLPKIKPLVWVDVFRDDKHANVKAETTFGKFCITVVEPIGCYVHAAPFYNWPFKECKSEADAKAWCQAEYERRVRECLE